MKLLSRLVGLCALSLSTAATAAPVINSVITSYSATGVPNSISIFGTGLCAATNCSTKPAVTLGGVTLSPVSGSVTGIVAPLGLIADGDYVLKLTTTGTTSTTYNLTVKSKSTSGTGTTIAVGTTVTGASGTSASVTNTGTATAAVLNFTIPQGSVGSQGPVGNAGPQGLQGAPGSTGSQGPQGPMGLQGLKGDKGDAGTAGADGAAGPQGPKGDTGTLPPGSAAGAMLYWNGNAWLSVAPASANGMGLIFCNGAPVWASNCNNTGTVQQITTVVTVDGKSGPWSPALNPSFDYGWKDNIMLQPAEVPLSPSTRRVTLDSVSGSVGLSQVLCCYDANGNTVDTYYRAQNGFPGLIIQQGMNIGRLIAVFTDDNGVIVGTPFDVGVGPVTKDVPAGAARLQLGINDAWFNDNAGSFSVRVLEFASSPVSVAAWAAKKGIRLDYIQPGKPQQNAYVERFNRTVRYEWLAPQLFASIAEVQLCATAWLWNYNHERPNMALGGITPNQRPSMAA